MITIKEIIIINRPIKIDKIFSLSIRAICVPIAEKIAPLMVKGILFWVLVIYSS